MKGVYFLADDAVLHWVLGMLASLRRHEPTLPVVWIPFGGPDRRLREHLDSYAVVAWSDTDDLEAWEDLGSQFFPKNLVGSRLFRKMAVFDGPFNEFVFIDSDVILRTSLGWAFEALSRAGAEVAFYDEGLADVYADPSLRQRMVEDYGARGWNTGFWAGHRCAIRYEMATILTPQALLVQPGFAPTGEQPFFNFVLDAGHVAAASLRDNSPLPARPRSLIVRRSTRVSADAPALHWAGQSRPSLAMPLVSIWLVTRIRAPRPASLAALVAMLVVRPLVGQARRLWSGLRTS